MEKDIGYSENFLSSFNQMRTERFICDFTLKIGNESFPVHRAVLAAASKYFTGMFSSNMKEVQEKCVIMKDLEVEGVRQCIEYMYTGCAKPCNDSVEYILKASHLIQLDGLSSICFKFLQKNLSVDTCISTFNISSFHDRDDVSKVSKTFVIEHFEAVILTTLFSFISKSDLVYYIKASEAEYQVAWQAVMRWFSVTREETRTDLLDVMKSINLIEFPFKFLLETVLTEPLVIENKPCQNIVISNLFDDASEVKRNLNTENVFTVKNLIKVHEIPNGEMINEAVAEYLEENFEELTNKKEFCQLEEEEIINLFQSSKTKYSSEKIKWDSALIWVKHDQRLRKKVFIKLFKSLKLELFSRDFLRETVRIEILVKESQKCKEILLDVSLGHVGQKCKTEQTLVPHIACLDNDEGDIKAWNLETKQWKNLPSVDITSTDVAGKRILNISENIYFLDYENLHELNLNQMKWIPKQPLVQKPSRFVEVVSFLQRIYVLDRDYMSYYIPADDVWVENLNGCGLGKLFCAASSDKFIYAMGGCSGGKCIADAKRFNIDTRSWSTIASMNTGRDGASGDIFREMVFVVGGLSNGGFSNSVEVYNPIFKIWTDIKDMRVRRNCPYACVANNQLYVVGGAWGEEGEFLDPDSIEAYDEDTGEWEIVAEMSVVSGYTPCCAISLKEENNDAVE